MSKELDFRNKTWRTADGRQVSLRDMQLGHLVNVLNWVHDHEGKYREDTKNNLVKEAEYRRLFAFTSREPYPGLVNDHWEIIDPVTGQGSIEKPPADYIEAVKDHTVYQQMSAEAQAKRKKERLTNKAI